jgi:uncharacterized protein
MKHLLLFLISCYNKSLSPLLKQILGIQYFCRHEVTCSTYAKLAIEKYGALQGSMLAIKRILSCQPLTKTYGKSL